MDFTLRTHLNLEGNKINRLNFSNLENMLENYDYADYYVQLNLYNNPMNCDCNIYDLLLCLQRDINQIKIPKIIVSIKLLFCQAPVEYYGVSVRNLNFTTFTCEKEKSQFSPDHPCGINGRCDCHFRPFDKNLYINCSGRNFFTAPKLLGLSFEVIKIELNLQENNLKEIIDMSLLEYNKIEFLDLSNNQISHISDRILSGNLKVLNKII